MKFKSIRQQPELIGKGKLYIVNIRYNFKVGLKFTKFKLNLLICKLSLNWYFILLKKFISTKEAVKKVIKQCSLIPKDILYTNFPIGIFKKTESPCANKSKMNVSNAFVWTCLLWRLEKCQSKQIRIVLLCMHVLCTYLCHCTRLSWVSN